MDNRYLEEGLVLQKQRAKYRLTQSEVASLSKVQFRVYQRFEYGIRTLASSQMKSGLAICALLDIDPYKVVFGMEREEYLGSMKRARNNLYNH